MSNEIKIVFKGRPITKKNHQRMAGKKLLQSEAYENYEESCLWQIPAKLKKEISGCLHVKALYYMKDRSSWPDLNGLMQSTGDILQKGRVIKNDRDIVSWDGTRIAGIDKMNPRVEITIKELEDWTI